MSQRTVATHRTTLHTPINAYLMKLDVPTCQWADCQHFIYQDHRRKLTSTLHLYIWNDSRYDSLVCLFSPKSIDGGKLDTATGSCAKAKSSKPWQILIASSCKTWIHQSKYFNRTVCFDKMAEDSMNSTSYSPFWPFRDWFDVGIRVLHELCPSFLTPSLHWAK